MGAPEAAPSPTPSSTHPYSEAPSRVSKVIKLSDADLSIIKHSVGCTADLESPTLIQITSTLWPPRGLPPGLYKSVVHSRTTSQYQYLLSSLLFNLSLILQILLGSAVTAIGSSTSHGTAVTVLAAANTVNAGLLALMHNSGLPERYKNDCNEFEEVEMWVRKLVETGVVEMAALGEDRWFAEEIVHECFERYAAAKRTVQKNKPSAYMPTVAKAVPTPGKSKEG